MSDRYYNATAAKVRIAALEVDKNTAYHERDMLVAALSKLWPSHLAWHEGEWEAEWRNIVCIHSPVGQLTWHIHERELPEFAHLEMDFDHWDGHTTGQKYERLESLDSVAPSDEEKGATHE